MSIDRHSAGTGGTQRWRISTWNSMTGAGNPGTTKFPTAIALHVKLLVRSKERPDLKDTARPLLAEVAVSGRYGRRFVLNGDLEHPVDFMTAYGEAVIANARVPLTTAAD
jgi:hypothetical protein